MCGIAGVAGESYSEDAMSREETVRRMLLALIRRGPDDEGLSHWTNATLGHRRLAIFDLSPAGRQPMLSADRSIGVVFNGAIYNFRELRQELQRCGSRFYTRSDTEVIVEGYQVWGIDSLIQRLRGMFAIALWDDRRRTMFLVRDRLGVKPLCFATRGNRLLFASTPRALTAGIVSDIDPEAVAEYLEFGHITDRHTIYHGLKKLPAASILEWHNGSTKEREYWKPTSSPVNSCINIDDAVIETERRLLDAVQMRLHADVPVGALLSGGIDSSLVCWATAKLGANIRAFTIGTPGDKERDETRDARQTAAELGIEHEVIDVSPADAPDIDELVAAYGEPFASPSALGMLRVSQAVRSSATVLLTGDGGDDAFLGYPEHRHFWIAEQIARLIPSPVAGWWTALDGTLPRQGPFAKAIRFMDYATGGLGAVTRNHDGLPYYREHRMLGPRLDGIDVHERAIPMSRKSATHLLDEFLEYHRHTYFIGEFMTKVDGGTMHYGLEARSPFLDHELWAFAHSLPVSIRLHGGLKAVLRELAQRRVSHRVARGRKRGFRIPVQRWLVGKWRERFEEAFHNSELHRAGWIIAPAVLEQLRYAARKPGFAPIQLWYLFVLEHWMRHERRDVAPALAPTSGFLS